MKTLDRQKLDFVSNTFGWRGQFTPDSKPIEFERFGIQAVAHLGFNSPEFEGTGNRPS